MLLSYFLGLSGLLSFFCFVAATAGEVAKAATTSIRTSLEFMGSGPRVRENLMTPVAIASPKI
jgi:hypothetical protein